MPDQQPRRRVLTYANVVATLALFFAMTGGAIAAKHYLIDSTSQINPKVLKKLHGATGAPGAPGTPGKAGENGKEGPQGPAGPFPATLPSGKTLTGEYSVAGFDPEGAKEAADAFSSVSFAYPLPAPAPIHFVRAGEHGPAACPGTYKAPTAQPGNICLYEYEGANVLSFFYWDQSTGTSNGRIGFNVSAIANGTGNFFTEGTWAATAP